MTPPPDQNVKIKQVFQKQIEESRRKNVLSFSLEYKKRLEALIKLEKGILHHQDSLKEAIYKDFRKSAENTDLTEIIPLLKEIKHNKKHLKKWMAPKRVKTPLGILGSSSKIIPEPKGVSLIISPWNYPIFLTLGPLVSALAAGNQVILKPSEHTPHTSKALGELIHSLFDESEVALFQGAVETSKTLLELPFHHIFVTGSPQLGKIVMSQAAKNLSSVTLELGGKSPCIIDETADLKAAAKRIAWGKFINNGQTCVAPDYCLVHHSVQEEFIKEMKGAIQNLYGPNPETSEYYARIINDGHFERLGKLIDQSLEMGAKACGQLERKSEERYISPTLLKDVPLEADIMHEEIFGPVLPLISYDKVEEVIDIIHSKERPLSLYLHSKDKDTIERIIQQTHSGGMVLNHNLIHLFNNDLPFGGVNHSGIGMSHGEFGFNEFTHKKAFVHQWFPISASDLLMAPFNDFKRTIIDLFKKYF